MLQVSVWIHVTHIIGFIGNGTERKEYCEYVSLLVIRKPQEQPTTMSVLHPMKQDRKARWKASVNSLSLSPSPCPFCGESSLSKEIEDNCEYKKLGSISSVYWFPRATKPIICQWTQFHSVDPCPSPATLASLSLPMCWSVWKCQSIKSPSWSCKRFDSFPTKWITKALSSLLLLLLTVGICQSIF